MHTPGAPNVPKAEEQLTSCQRRTVGTEVGRASEMPQKEASPGHVTNIGARERPGILTGAGRQHILERERNAAWRVAGPAPGLQGPEGPGSPEARCSSAPGAAAGCTASQRGKKERPRRWTLRELPGYPPKHSRRFLLQAPSKNKLLQDQRRENTQTSIRKYSRRQTEKGAHKFLPKDKG